MDTTTEVTTADDVLAECSDEEEFGKLGVKLNNSWSPFPNEICALYEQVANKSLEFNWKCIHGRRDPDDERPIAPTKQQDTVIPFREVEPEATDFDFEDDMNVKTTPQLSRFGKSPALKASSKKKTSSLAGILSNMERHRILDQKPVEKLSKSQIPSITRTSS